MRRAVLLTCTLVACSSPAPDRIVLPPKATPLAHAIDLGMAPVAVDARGLPRLMRASSRYTNIGGIPRFAALAHIEKLAPAWGVADHALPALQPLGDVPLRAGTMVRVQQVIDGLPVDGGELRVLTRDTGELIAINGVLVGTTTPRVAPHFELADPDAIGRALADAYGAFDARTLTAHTTRRAFVGRSGMIDVQLAAARKAWVVRDDRLVAAWIVEAYAGRADSTTGDAFRAVVAGDGRVLERYSLVADAAFTYRVFADDTGEFHPFDGPIVDPSPHPTGIPDNSYPAFVAPNLVLVDGLNHPPNNAAPDPWLLAGKTETQGNNVEAYVDLNAPSGLTFGDFRATTTGPTTFDRTYDTALDPLSSQKQQMAAVTSLFFIINWLHDFWYDAGFVETAGNGQDSNFGRGGQDRDAILAEAQDNALGGSRNNANMSTPSDGLPPRMQVFLWDGLDEKSLQLAPSGRSPLVGVAGYGVGVFDVTADVVLADDGTDPNPHDLCEAPINDLTGKIVLVDRGGGCSFESKALKIQNAGGVGMLLADNVVNPTPPTLGDDANLVEPITIGQLSILQSEGDALKADLLAGTVTATMHRLVGPDLDGAVDATLVAHEFGHYVHHRLQNCNTRMCAALSEGWGDFLSLMIMAKAGDDFAGAFPLAVYATPNFTTDAAYFGIRRVPYSISTSLNALSFRHMGNGVALPTTHPMLTFGVNAEVHNAGEIWATAMWEAYVALIQAIGFDEARKRMASYVVTGLMLAPTDGTPTETRDAILLAALTTSQEDHDTLAAAFARRGMGSCAVSPDRASGSFTGIVESSELHANVVAATPVIAPFRDCDADGVIDAGETGRVVVAVSNRGAKPVSGATVTLTSTTPGVTVTTPPFAIDVKPYDSTTFAIDVALDASVSTPIAGAFEIAISGADTCEAPFVVSATARLNVDDVPASTATDSFDTAESAWVPTFFAIWQHERRSALDGFWHGVGLPQIADGSIESPPLVAGVDPVTMTFTHRYQFESSGTVHFDGGVIEFSLDDGEHWIDMLSLVPTIGYDETAISSGGNPLNGQRAFVGTSPGHPATETVTLDFGTQLAHQTFRVRFRIGTDPTGASTGWDIDDVAFTGLVGTPFPSQVTNTGTCGDRPPGDAGQPPPDDGGCCDAGPLRPANALVALGVLALLIRRRRDSLT